MERIDFDDIASSPSPRGSGRTGVVTYEETNDLLVDGIFALIKRTDGEYWMSKYELDSRYPKLTVHKCWSGYSEYTITDQWDEIEIDWGKYHFYFEHLPAFFKALEEASDWERNY